MYFVRLILAGLMHLWSPTHMLSTAARLDGLAITRDATYAPGARHGVDVYASDHAHNAPVVVFLYGGGWETGDKATYRFVGAALAARGMVVVIPDYRLHPAVQYPAFMDDVSQAVSWAHANARRFGGDPARLFLMGHSAGATMAALLALDLDYLRSAEVPICGLIGLAGLYDYPLIPERKAVFGAESNWPKSQPVNYVRPDAPPMLLLVGASDGVAGPGDTLRMAAHLKAAGDDAEAAVYPGIGHTGIIAAFGDALTFLAPAREATVRFIESHRTCPAG